MWIKASGTWLAHAESSELFVPVELAPLLSALEVGDVRAEKSVDFVQQDFNPHNLRPSIETTVHAVLPQQVVVHVHCVDTIALAVQTDGQQQLHDLLSAFNWLWVPYHRPGLPLSQYISKHIQAGMDVIVLGNHGLVVAADSVEDAAELLDRVRAAVQQPARAVSEIQWQQLNKLTTGTQYEPATDIATHAVALDEVALRTADGGSLYPDHVIFLGAGSAILDPELQGTIDLSAVILDAEQPPASIVVAGMGVLMHKKANASQQALARCLSDVGVRIASDAAINYLTEHDEYQLLNWEAETYRQSIAT